MVTNLKPSPFGGLAWWHILAMLVFALLPIVAGYRRQARRHRQARINRIVDEWQREGYGGR